MFLPQILYGKTILISGLYPITKRPPLNGPQISILDWDFKLNLFYTATHHKPRWWIASTIDHFRLQDLLCWTPNRALTERLLDTPAANANVLTGSDPTPPTPTPASLSLWEVLLTRSICSLKKDLNKSAWINYCNFFYSRIILMLRTAG